MNSWLLLALIFVLISAIEFAAMNYCQQLDASDAKDGWGASVLGSMLPGTILFLAIFCGIASIICWWFGV